MCEKGSINDMLGQNQMFLTENSVKDTKKGYMTYELMMKCLCVSLVRFVFAFSSFFAGKSRLKACLKIEN